MKKLLVNPLMLLVLAMVVAACGSTTEDESQEESQGADQEAGQEESAAEQKDYTISFGVTPWTSTVPPTNIAKVVFEDMGYEVEETQADVGSVFAGLSRGDLDVYMDSWLPAHDNYVERYSDSIEETAVSYSEASRGFVVPEYMEDVNSISDLIGREDEFNNEFYGIEEGASATITVDEVLEGYELDMEQVNSSEGGMMAEAERHMNSEDPVVFYGWRPHSMFNIYDIKVLEDEKEIFETPSIHVFANNELQENAPDAYEFLTNWSIDVNDVEEMIVQIENEEADPREVAEEWIENNQDKVDEMKGE